MGGKRVGGEQKVNDQYSTYGGRAQPALGLAAKAFWSVNVRYC